MFENQPSFDKDDAVIHQHLNRWVVLKWRGDLFPPAGGLAYGTHLATFLFWPPDEQIRGLNYCWVVQSTSGHFYRVGGTGERIEATWFFVYSTLRQFHLITLTDQQIESLQLPDLESPSKVDARLREFRNARHLDQFRHPGYPDDLQVVLSHGSNIEIEGMQLGGEIVWVRINCVIDDSRFRGHLLNQPTFFKATRGDPVEVRLISSASDSILACTPVRPDTDECGVAPN